MTLSGCSMISLIHHLTTDNRHVGNGLVSGSHVTRRSAPQAADLTGGKIGVGEMSLAGWGIGIVFRQH